ncbi:MAG: hypothetical protein K6B46_05300 [Opitutales bacterium]|nr:hypothetical protein [Opitutales bacterium]
MKDKFSKKIKSSLSLLAVGTVFFLGAGTAFADFSMKDGGNFDKNDYIFKKIIPFTRQHYAEIFDKKTECRGEVFYLHFSSDDKVVFNQKFLDLSYEDAKKLVFETELSFSEILDLWVKKYDTRYDIPACFLFDCEAKNNLLTRTDDVREMAEIISDIAKKYIGFEETIKRYHEFFEYIDGLPNNTITDDEAYNFCEKASTILAQQVYGDFIFKNKNIVRFIDMLTEKDDNLRRDEILQVLEIYDQSHLEKHIGRLSDHYLNLLNFKNAYLGKNLGKNNRAYYYWRRIREVENERRANGGKIQSL